MSKRSHSKDSLHGALVTPVISRSIDTKSASLTRHRRSVKADSKFDLVTFLREKVVDGDDVVVEEQRERVREARIRVFETALTIHCFFIFCLS